MMPQTKLDIRRLGAPEFMLARTVFNLAGETGEDPERVARERRESEQRRREAEAYQAKVQLLLKLCPGFVGCDAPLGPGCKGKVVVEPGCVIEAGRWLKRRYHVSEDLELSGDQGIVFEIAPRIRRLASRGVKVKVRFGKPQQFELQLV